VGSDTIAASVLLGLRQRVELILPFQPEVLARKWGRAQQAMLRDHIRRAAAVRVLEDRDYDVRAYHRRNRALVAGADLLVAFYNDGFEFTGTGATVREAERRGVPVIRVGV